MSSAIVAVLVLLVLLAAGALAAGRRDRFALCPDGVTRCDGCQCCPGHTVCPNAGPGCHAACGGFALCPDGATRCDGCQCCPDGTLCPNASGCAPGLCPGGAPWAPIGPPVDPPWAPIGPPTPPVPPPAEGTYVELVNGTGATLLAGADGPTAIRPAEGRWHFGPGEKLTFAIPAAWKHTQGNAHVNGPRFWVRTGCAFDPATDKAQCETGDCGGYYDCSRAGLAGVAPASLAEFCFECGSGLTYYDVSLVDGYNLSVDIEPLPPHPASRPGDPGNPFWCRGGAAGGAPLCRAGADLRAACPAGFALRRSQLAQRVPGEPDAVVACFSNCGRYEYPTAPAADCGRAGGVADPKCPSWRKYCCQSGRYGRPCRADADCDFGGACWGGVCSCRAYYQGGPGSCPASVCTNPGGAAQPPPQKCSAPECIGDDTLHAVCPRAYTWPNDPQTYSCSAAGYRITFGPGWGSARDFPLTPAGPIPRCGALPAAYFDAAKAGALCGEKGTYGCAKTVGSGRSWDCDVDDSGCDGVLCRW